MLGTFCIQTLSWSCQHSIRIIPCKCPGYISSWTFFFQRAPSSPTFTLDKKLSFVGIIRIVRCTFHLLGEDLTLNCLYILNLAYTSLKTVFTAVQRTESSPQFRSFDWSLRILFKNSSDHFSSNCFLRSLLGYLMHVFLIDHRKELVTVENLTEKYNTL